MGIQSKQGARASNVLMTKLIERILEPELMDDPGQALAYAEADFEAAHGEIVHQFGRVFPGNEVRGRVMDLGCGPADFTVRFAHKFPNCQIEGIDGSEPMLKLGRERIAREGLSARIQLFHRVLPDERLVQNVYSTVISNSLLHHLHDPLLLWSTVKRIASGGALVFIADLRRPETKRQAGGLVRTYSAGEPQLLKRDFYHSLLAAFTPQEVQRQLLRSGLNTLKVEIIDDRHLLIFGQLS